MILNHRFFHGRVLLTMADAAGSPNKKTWLGAYSVVLVGAHLIPQVPGSRLMQAAYCILRSIRELTLLNDLILPLSPV